MERKIISVVGVGASAHVEFKEKLEEALADDWSVTGLAAVSCSDHVASYIAQVERPPDVVWSPVLEGIPASTGKGALAVEELCDKCGSSLTDDKCLGCGAEDGKIVILDADEIESVVVTVWKGGAYEVWGAMDAHYAKADPDFLVNIGLKDILKKESK